MTDFQRARQPEQKEQRRAAILVAAAALFDQEGPNGAGLNAIAARAGFTKSNVYRYFESREEVLIQLFLAEMDELTPDVTAAFARCDQGDIAALAEAFTQAYLARPRLCHLTSILSVTLEQNVTTPTILALKQSIAGQFTAMAKALHTRLPSANIDDCTWALGMSGVLLAGMWPGANPAPAVDAVLAQIEFEHLKPNPARDLPRAIRALLTSIV